jgi:hypothetical protein
LSLKFMDKVGSGFQACRCLSGAAEPLTGNVATPRRSTAAAQKG